jgi:hypothetical protein
MVWQVNPALLSSRLFYACYFLPICGSVPPCRSVMDLLPYHGVKQRDRQDRFFLPTTLSPLPCFTPKTTSPTRPKSNRLSCSTMNNYTPSTNSLPPAKPYSTSSASPNWIPASKMPSTNWKNSLHFMQSGSWANDQFEVLCPFPAVCVLFPAGRILFPTGLIRHSGIDAPDICPCCITFTRFCSIGRRSCTILPPKTQFPRFLSKFRGSLILRTASLTPFPVCVTQYLPDDTAFLFAHALLVIA